MPVRKRKEVQEMLYAVTATRKRKESRCGMNQYQFEQVCRRMEKRYGKIRKGRESQYEEMLRAIETNLLTVHRLNRACDSRRVAVRLSSSVTI